MIAEIYDEEYIAVVEGNREVNARLFEERWDLIFFTGSPALGRTVMEAAARHLTPVVLELGGKSPCIVDRGADIEVAARRIAWGKTLNAGQTCIAPDYLLIREELPRSSSTPSATRCGACWATTRGKAPTMPGWSTTAPSTAWPPTSGRAPCGWAESDRAERYIEPTLLTKVDPTAPVMQEEIFGPVLPMIPFREQSEIVDFITAREKAAGALLLRAREAGPRDPGAHLVGRGVSQRHDHADRQRPPAVRRRGQLGHGPLPRPRQLRRLRTAARCSKPRRGSICRSATCPTACSAGSGTSSDRPPPQAARSPKSAPRSKFPSAAGGFSRRIAYLCPRRSALSPPAPSGEESPGNTEHHAS